MIGIETRLKLGLKLELAYKSIDLEKIYIPSIIQWLKKEQKSDLDGMFFGITKLWYKDLIMQVQNFIIKNIKVYHYTK